MSQKITTNILQQQDICYTFKDLKSFLLFDKNQKNSFQCTRCIRDIFEQWIAIIMITLVANSILPVFLCFQMLVF